MSEVVEPSVITAESQIENHVRENYVNVKNERGYSWSQMSDEFAKSPNGHLLSRWAQEMAAAEEGGFVPGIETRGEVTGVAETADAPEKRKRGNVSDLDPVEDEVAE